jgi:hypothetical protein
MFVLFESIFEFFIFSQKEFFKTVLIHYRIPPSCKNITSTPLFQFGNRPGSIPRSLKTSRNSSEN